MNAHTLELSGLDGSNPLAFLAAVGTLRASSLAMPKAAIRMGWHQANGAWRPMLTATQPLDTEITLDALTEHLAAMRGHDAFARWDNLSIAAHDFREYLFDAVMAATREDRVWADFAAAFGCDAIHTASQNTDLIEDTAFRTMGGAGHQDFLGFMRKIIDTTDRDHLRKSLLEEWRYDDPVTNSTLRWDPVDDVRRALQWRDPSGDPGRKTGGCMLGANRLAIEALPLFPTAPIGRRLRTTGFSGSGRKGTFWTWPIWNVPIGLETCRSVLALEALQVEKIDSALRLRGIAAAFRSQRITEGKYRNFTPGRAVL